MTSEEIVKALRTCVMDPDDGGDCENCPASRSEGEYCLTAVMSEAASLIEQLRREIEWKDSVIDCAQKKRAEATAERDALREKKRWISVTEKTPEYDMQQLALNADGDALIANYAYGEWFDTWGQDVEVTHWMPLPEAPEEGGKA